ncbi:MAG: acyl-[acyl-carrier-protein]--UDP-N-acetylglucosamine O-acyltransferase, partial [Elusimicrobiota bacterium]|nr:acyl-[acyl-carrier-protein]--UDP-N-acetylglucosamine O-acyltransferase [Elusimicrobiota bacterium]
NMLMSYVHIAHDCRVENKTVLANCATLAGHVTVQSGVIIGGLTPIHQFTRIGKLAIIGGASRVTNDIVPYCKAAGNPLKMYGLNIIGLKRSSFTNKERKELKEAYRIIFRRGLSNEKAIEQIRNSSLVESKHVSFMVEFIGQSERGIAK